MTKKTVENKNKKINGQDKCPKCGATDISINPNNSHLRCNFCRFEYTLEKVDEVDVSKLDSKNKSIGLQDIEKASENIITLKCTSCGAEVVIDTNESLQSRCHWCRNFLSLNEQIPNGSVPDLLLPFRLLKEEGQEEIERFVGKRKFFAHPVFKKEFTTENVLGVYFPYIVSDINAHADFKGEGEHLVRSYTEGTEKNKRVYYDADLYQVKREFDILIKGLTVESSSERLDKVSNDKTNNIINSIMPFDVENCVQYNANYLRGFTSERRDINVSDIEDYINIQAKDIARFSINKDLSFYNRGVRWYLQNLDIKGSSYKAAYLPVWLYSYQQVKNNNKILHYVAVNARTYETMGSVPIHYPKLVIASIFVELFGGILMYFIDFDYNWIFLSSGFLFFIYIYARYRNSSARHYHEKETKNEMNNIKREDKFLEHRYHLSNATLSGANNKLVEGKEVSGNFIESFISETDISEFIPKK